MTEVTSPTATDFDALLGEADEVEEPVERAQVVADVSPGVMRTMAERDRAWPKIALHALELADDDVEGFVPADALVAGNPAIVRVPLAIGIEIDALHRIQQTVLRIDQRLRA